MRNLERVMELTAPGRACLADLESRAVDVLARRKLTEEGRPCDGFYIVLDGWLSEYRQLRNGQRQVLNFRLPGEIAGIEFLLYRTALHSAVTLSNCRLAWVDRATFEEIQCEFPRLAVAFLLTRVTDGAILEERTVNLGRRPAIQRLAHLLLELERRQNGAGGISGSIAPFPLTQQDIADCTGLTAPYVNRLLQELRTRGLVRAHGAGLEIPDLPALAAAAGFSPDYLIAGRPLVWKHRQETIASSPASEAGIGVQAAGQRTMGPSHSAPARRAGASDTTPSRGQTVAGG